jgi:hypothetical protein
MNMGGKWYHTGGGDEYELETILKNKLVHEECDRLEAKGLHPYIDDNGSVRLPQEPTP